MDPHLDPGSPLLVSRCRGFCAAGADVLAEIQFTARTIALGVAGLVFIAAIIALANFMLRKPK